MDVMTAIMTRRSIRKYTGQQLDEACLQTILEAGFAAPSAHNLRPVSFVIVNDSMLTNSISEFDRYARMLTGAGCGIVVCADLSRQKLEGFAVEDCSAAMQNMLLAAHSLGLGAVWCGIHPVEILVEKFSELLALPSHVIPVGMVVVGHKAEEVSPLNRFDKAKIHYNKW